MFGLAGRLLGVSRVVRARLKDQLKSSWRGDIDFLSFEYTFWKPERPKGLETEGGSIIFPFLILTDLFESVHPISRSRPTSIFNLPLISGCRAAADPIDILPIKFPATNLAA